MYVNLQTVKRRATKTPAQDLETSGLDVTISFY